MGRKIIIAPPTQADWARRGLRSPFRYAGGKSWFVKIASKWMANRPVRPKLLVEPFAGGANVSLSAVCADLVDKAEFSELDRDVAAAWKSMLNGHADWLAEKVRTFPIGRRNVIQHLKQKPGTLHERAFQCLLRNRTARGGVIADGAGFASSAGKSVARTVFRRFSSRRSFTAVSRRFPSTTQ